MKHLRRNLIVLLSGVSLMVMVMVMVPASLQAECLAVDFVYEHREAMLAIKDPAQKNDYMRKAISSAWSRTSDTASKTIMAYGMGEGMATAPSRALAEKALSLSHTEMLKLAKGAPVDQQRIAKTLSKIKQGVAVTDDLNIWMDRVGIAVDAINLIDWTITSMQTGDRYAKAKAAQSALSIARTITAKVAGGTMGAMMASASFIDYAVSSFGEAAHAAYDANWYNAYREYYDNGGRNGAFWVDLRQRGGDQAVEAELNKFWDDPGAYANLQGKDVPRPFIGDALAIAKQKKAYAGRYMTERIEPMVAQETADRAEAAWEVASQEYRRACYAAKAEAQTLQTVETMLASLQTGGDANERLFFAVRRNDLDAIDAALDDGGDPLKIMPDQGYSALDAGIILMISEGDGQDGIARLLASGVSLDQAFTGQDQTPLTAAIDHNATSAVAFLLKHGYPVDKPRRDGRTALMLAAFKGQQETVTTLLSAGASVTPVDGDGIDALGYAANGSRANVIPLLISAGAQPNRLATNGLTPLIIAAARGNMATVLALIDGGASPVMKGKSGTASHYASLKGHTEIAEYLKGLETSTEPLEIVSVGPFQPTIISGNVEFVDLRVAKQTQGPLDWKVYIDDVAIVGWRPRATSEEGTFSFEVVAKNEGTSNFTVRVTDAVGNKGSWSAKITSESLLGNPFGTPEVFAAEGIMRFPDGLSLPNYMTDIEVAISVPAKRKTETASRHVELAVYAPDGQQILSFSDEIEYRDSYGPEEKRVFGLDLAICIRDLPPLGESLCRPAGEYRVVGRHLSDGEVKEAVARFHLGDPYEREAENWGIGPAVAAGDLDRLERIAKTGKAKLFDNGFTELDAAVRSNNPTLVNRVLAFGVDPNVSVAGYTPLLRAMMPGNYMPNAARALISAGANVNVIWEKSNLSTLHLAAMAKDKEMFRTLLNRGTHITRDSKGYTPGYYMYWLTKDTELAVAAGYPEAREYEAKANDPGFDWAEFARRMQPALQQFGQNVSAAQQQYNQRVAEINDTYNSQLGQMYGNLNQTQSPYSTGPSILSSASPELNTSGGTNLSDCKSVSDQGLGETVFSASTHYWDDTGRVKIDLYVATSPCKLDKEVSFTRPINICGKTLYWSEYYDTGKNSDAREFADIQRNNRDMYIYTSRSGGGGNNFHQLICNKENEAMIRKENGVFVRTK